MVLCFSAYIAKGKYELASQELNKLQSIANSPNADQYRVGATPASSVLKVAAYGLQGELHMAKEEYGQAIESFRNGVKIEDGITIPNLLTGLSL